MTLLVGRQEGHPACKKTEWWSAGVVIYLERGANLHTAQLMPLPLTVSCSVKSRLALPFWYQLTRVVPGKGPLNGCVCASIFYRFRDIAGYLSKVPDCWWRGTVVERRSLAGELSLSCA